MARILVVDDEPAFRTLLREILEEAEHEVVEARDGAEALAFLDRGAFHLVLTDQRMPKLDGMELVRRLRARPSPPPVVLLTAHGTIPDAVEAVRLGAADYITKPLRSPGALVSLVNSLLRKDEGDEFVTSDPKMDGILALADRVAASDIPVLVTGESGTGKELIARRLHSRSSRSRAPFVALNCAALPESLAESELFGNEKGAFTGADQARAGRFEEASGGTLFLDEIGELPLSLQAKLLRVLEGRTIRRLGGARDVPVDTRLITATNRDLTAEGVKGSFRTDLYFRIAVVTIHLPPLRERPADIAAVARHLLDRLSRRHRIASAGLTESALEALARHSWPGNVRELRNVLERAIVIRGPEPLRPEDLALDSVRPQAAPLLRDQREREAVLEALRRSDGRREEAARLLGISVRTLYYRLKEWGLS